MTSLQGSRLGWVAVAALTVFAVAFALRLAVTLPALAADDWRRFERPDTPSRATGSLLSRPVHSVPNI